jgi:hypothetical protein
MAQALDGKACTDRKSVRRHLASAHAGRPLARAPACGAAGAAGDGDAASSLRLKSNDIVGDGLCLQFSAAVAAT